MNIIYHRKICTECSNIENITILARHCILLVILVNLTNKGRKHLI